MNQDLYVKLKKALNKYDFNKDKTNFPDLYMNSKKYLGFWVPFRQFTNYVKAMGVSSQVRRVAGGVQRGLVFEPNRDKYLLKLFPVLDTCPTCKGKGVVEIELTA